MAVIPINTLPLSIERIQYILGHTYVKSVLSSPQGKEELHKTIQEILDTIQEDMTFSPLLVPHHVVRLSCVCWLLSEKFHVPIDTKNFTLTRTIHLGNLRDPNTVILGEEP